jgi:hypothetical protein
MTASNRVGIRGQELISTFTPDTSIQEINITDYIREEYIEGASVVSLAIVNRSDILYVYNSRESSYPPQIVLILSDTPLPTSTPTPTPTIQPQPTATPTPTPASEPPDTTLSFTTSDPIVAVGSEFPVYVRINTGINEVIGAELDISRSNSNVLTALDIAAGDFFANPDETNENIDNAAGTIAYTILTPPSISSVRGIGNLAVIDFRADTIGTTTLTFDTDTLVAAKYVYGNALETRYPITIEVVSQLCGNEFLPGDITGPDGPDGPADCKVNLLDYNQLFEDFGSTATQAVDPDSDINSDGMVNVLDYVYLFENFGRSI